jgi:hypothetical protein
MDAATALRVVRDITYKPGWTFDARERDGGVHLLIEFRAPNSDSYWAPEYPQTIIAGGAFQVSLTGCRTEMDVWNLVFQCVMAIELHEAQEFFAVDARWKKPYHPHTHVGRLVWEGRRPVTVELSDTVEPHRAYLTR